MAFWKQLLFSLGLLVVAGALWARFFPGAPQMLERWGMDWAVAAVSQEDAGETASGKQPRDGGGFGHRTPLVVTSEIQTATINDRMEAIGTGRALNSVAVTPFVSGRLTEIHVSPGDRIDAGDVIAELDSEMEEIEVDRARIALEDARARLERVNALRASNTVSAVQVNEAQLAVSNAELELRDAQLTLERRSIRAPIGGIVGILPVAMGNYVTSQTEIATIDDRSRIIIDFWVPERFASLIKAGQAVTATSIARPNERFRGEVSAVDNRVDPQSRTLLVQARIDNQNDLLRAGMSFEVAMSFAGDTYPAVDPLAIQWSADGAFIWLVDNGKARRTNVQIIQRNTDNVLVAGDFGEALTVVTQGVHGVREGAELRIAQRNDETPEMPQAGPDSTGT